MIHLDHILREMTGQKSFPLATLEEARTVPDGVVILEGDWGGIIFATCPVKYVGASHQEIETLCKALEASFWPSNLKNSHEGGWGVCYARKTPGEGVLGGMGGGRVIDGLWIHSKLNPDLAAQITSNLKVIK